ncbi:WAT1-related protein At5g47470-like [Typha angustifolia]|uniref:WAT1-related protein At5g47470-like n=1 Tax=Typha angustifolia TaxID=59011 RepID=UPI003C2D275F
MLGQSRGRFMEELLIISGLFAVQCIFGVYVLALNQILSRGVNSLFIIVFGSLASAVILLPFALVFEKKKWPARLSPLMMAQLVLLALGGAMFQVLMFLGIERTSPAVASAMPNLAPGLIFIVAACVRLEKFERKCKYTRAKILGTFVCLSGAIAMSFLQSPPTSPRMNSFLNGNLNKSSYSEWILGCFYLLAGVVVLSCSTVLQAATLVHFPAPLSLCVITSMMAALFTAILQIIVNGKLDAGSHDISNRQIVEIVIIGGAAVGGCVAFQAWCVGKKGPVLVSIFNPIQTVFSVIISAVLLKQMIGLGSSAGILLMFSGLYIVLWAKNKEGFDLLEADNTDIEKPLLH